MKPLWWIDRVASDTRLSANARCLLVWFGTRPGGWRYSVAEAESALGFERKKYQRVLKSVKDAGWLETEYKRDRHGRIKYVKLILRDTASPEGANSTLSDRATRRCQMKPSGPEGANSTQTSKKNIGSPSQGFSPRVVGGRDA